MCGIAGIYDTTGRVERDQLAAMIGQIRHRGPDGTGFFAYEGIGLAHARLSIIDIEGGAQPIHNEDGTVWVVFNGEIFNYVELRRDLEGRGHRFYTRSDTEVIVHAYEEFGDEFVHHLNGQFAIALWDAARRRLVLVRDRVGIRPLFYMRAGRAFLFASEIKALFAHPNAPRALDPAALGQLFMFWSPVAPATPFRDVSSLPPGHMLVLQGDEVRVSRYWDWSFPEPDGLLEIDADTAVEALRAQLVDAVRLQVRADVPVGAYVSGGIDSALIVALLRRYTDTPIRTFSLRFEDAEFDEGVYQRALVADAGTSHTEFLCSRRDIAEAFPRAIWHIESPILRTAPVPLMLLSGLVRREGYKVVLTGEGADEILAGYDLFKEARIRRFWARRPDSRWRPALFRRLYPYLAHSPIAIDGYARRFFGDGIDDASHVSFGHIPRWRNGRRNWRFLSGELQQRAAQRDPLAVLAERLPSAMGAWAPLQRDQYLEAMTLLSGYILHAQGDRASLANSVEGRVPFLDHRVIEFCNRLPPRFKLMGLQEKWLLKRAARGIVPDAIIDRPKQPYRAPDSSSFFRSKEAHAQVDDILSPSRVREAGYFDAPAVAALVAKCRMGRAIGFADNMAFVGIYSTMLMHEMFVRRVGPISSNAGPIDTLMSARGA